MSWRLARGLEKLRAQVNAKWPNRSKDSDGSVGDLSHSARTSDHNPDANRVVHAIDLTHDPKHGFDSYSFADHILKQQDPRLKYVISNGRIGSGPAGPSPGKWRKYNGANRHDHHVHFSIVSGALQDDARPWDIDGALFPPPEVVASYVKPNPTVKRGSEGEYVKLLQSKLGMPVAELDGRFGEKTFAALIAFQKSRGLVADGIAGPQVWSALK